MWSSIQSGCCLFMAMLLSATVLAHEDDPQLNDPEVQKTLRAMNDSSTWYHPDLFGEFAGLRHYAHHEYKDALKYLEIGAYCADKLSQLTLGLMYMNGEGTDKDPATALAWFTIAAERGYPKFIATRDELKATMTAEQLARSEEIGKALQARYGDAVAMPRMVAQLRQGQMQITGSRTGFDAGVSHLKAGPGKDDHAQIGGGGDRYAKNQWDPNTYFKQRDAQWKATVTVGDLSAGQTPSSRTGGDSAAPQSPPGQHP